MDVTPTGTGGKSPAGRARDRAVIERRHASSMTGSRKERASFGVIFDMNGTMVDDQPYQRRAWQVICEKYGRDLTDEDYRLHIAGHEERDVLAYLFGADFPADKGRLLAEQKRKLYLDTFDPQKSEVPGLRQLLAELARDDVPVALATSANTATLNFILDRLGVRDLFDVVVQADEVSRGKPAPDIYLHAADKLGISPGACIVFEDSPAGVASAKDAGMICIGLATALSPGELMSANADLVIADFRGIHPATLSSMMEKRRSDGP